MMFLPVTSIAFSLLLEIAFASCPDGWISSGQETGKCYFHDRRLMNWRDAFDICGHLNVTLVSIHDMRENNLITELLASQTAWIGFYSEASDNACPFGHNVTTIDIDPIAKPPLTRTFAGQDESDASFRVWSHGGHLGSHIQPDCTAPCCFTFIDADGMWNDQDVNDEERKHTVLCSQTFNATSRMPHSFPDGSDRDILIQWDRDLDFLLRVNSIKMDQVVEQGNSFHEALEKLSSSVKETRSLMVVFSFICLVTFTTFCVLVSLLFRKLYAVPCFGPKNIRFQTLVNEEDRI